MIKLSPHFSRNEFACHCGCGGDTVDVELLTVLEDVRRYFGLPVIIISGFRCQAHNIDVKGTPGSKHLIGKAADFIVKSRTTLDVFDYLWVKYTDRYGMGKYDTWVHFDSRADKARW